MWFVDEGGMRWFAGLQGAVKGEDDAAEGPAAAVAGLGGYQQTGLHSRSPQGLITQARASTHPGSSPTPRSQHSVGDYPHACCSSVSPTTLGAEGTDVAMSPLYHAS